MLFFLQMATPAGSNSTSTREKLLGLVDDIELITKEIFENSIAAKAKRLTANEHEELTTLLIQKDAELKETMSLASEQGDIDKKMKALEEEVQKQDNCIKQLQKHLKDAETVLSTAIYQARQKLDSIHKARENPVSSEDLIKYAHRISASNAVVAPLTWQQGDPRRPYPTDMEMRLGLLGRPEQAALEMSRNAQASGAGATAPDSSRGGRTPSSTHGGPTPGGPMPGPSGPPMHHPDFHHPSPQHPMMHTSPTKMHPGAGPGHPPHHHPFQWGHGDMQGMGGGAGAGQRDHMEPSGMHHFQQQQQQQQYHGGAGGMPHYPPMGVPPGGGQQQASKTDDVEVMSTDSSSSSSTDSN